jgi:hypothetical protein
VHPTTAERGDGACERKKGGIYVSEIYCVHCSISRRAIERSERSRDLHPAQEYLREVGEVARRPIVYV